MLTGIAIRRMGLLALVGLGLALGAAFAYNGPEQAMAVVVAIVAAAGYVLAPEAAILSLVALRPVVDVFVFRVSFAGLNVGVFWAGLMVAFCGFYLLTRPSAFRRVARMVAVPLLFVALLAVLSWTRPDFMFAVQETLKVGAWLILAVTIAAIASRSEGRATVLRFMGYAAIVTAATILVLILQNRYGSAYYAHNLTYMQDVGPHGLAYACVTVLPFTLLAILTHKRILVPLITACLLSLEVVLSYVRSAYLCFAVIMLVFSVIALKGSRARTRMIGVGVWVLVAAAGYFVQDELIRRLADLLGRSNQWTPNAIGSGRNLVWSAVWDQSTATPLRTLLGAGSRASMDYTAAAGLGVLSGPHVDLYWAHNDVLETLAIGGVVLLCAYLLLFWWMSRAAIGVARMKTADWSSRSFGYLATATVVGFLILSVANSVVFSLPACTFMGVLIGVCYGFLASGERELVPAQERAGHSWMRAPA